MLSSAEWSLFQAKNPWLKVDVEVAGARHPFVRGEYVHGNSKTVCVRNASPTDVLTAARRLRDQFGLKSRSLVEDKRHTSLRPSIQGSWTPDFVPPALTPSAIQNAQAKKNFIPLEGYDHSKHIYAPTLVKPSAASQPVAPSPVVIPRRGKAGKGGPRRLYRLGAEAAASILNKAKAPSQEVPK